VVDVRFGGCSLAFLTGVLDGSELSGFQKDLNGVQRRVCVVLVSHFSEWHNWSSPTYPMPKSIRDVSQLNILRSRRRPVIQNRQDFRQLRTAENCLLPVLEDRFDALTPILAGYIREIHVDDLVKIDRFHLDQCYISSVPVSDACNVYTVTKDGKPTCLL
jgi:hypothetical protein